MAEKTTAERIADNDVLHPGDEIPEDVDLRDMVRELHRKLGEINERAEHFYKAVESDLKGIRCEQIALCFSLVDAVLMAPSERTPKRIAEYVRMNYAALGEHSAAGGAMIGFIASRLEGAEAQGSAT